MNDYLGDSSGWHTVRGARHTKNTGAHMAPSQVGAAKEDRLRRPNPTETTMKEETEMQPMDFLASGGAAVKFSEVGDAIVLTLSNYPKIVDGTDFDGNPIQQLRIDGVDDAGDERSIYVVKKKMGAAIRAALIESGASDFETGAKLAVELYGVAEPHKAGVKGAQLFRAQYKRPAATAESEPVAATDLL